MNKLGAQLLMVPHEKVAKHWQDFYWPYLREGLLVKQDQYGMLCGNILNSILTDRVGVLSFWWFDEDNASIYTLALISITVDRTTGLVCLNVYSLVSVKQAKPNIMREFIAGLKKFMVSKKIDRLVADIGNDKWAQLLTQLEPSIKSHTTLTMEVKQ